MYAFLSNSIPLSVHATVRKPRYYTELRKALQLYNKKAGLLSGNLYGFVYYFHKRKTQLDADNLSEPVWDALNQAAYLDDKQIIFRSSGIFDLGSEGIEIFDFTDVPNKVLVDFLEMIDDDTKDHILYIEVGKFDYDLYRFGYEK